MNLKEAFQMQKTLSRLMEEAASYLDDTDNIMTVTEKHLRSKVVPEQADESVDCSEKSRMAYNPMTVLRAWHALMEEKERLGRAITAAKTAMPLNFDTAAEENKARRRFLHTLAHMAEQRSDSRMRRGAGKGYVFNKDGNQTPYCYDIEVVIDDRLRSECRPPHAGHTFQNGSRHLPRPRRGTCAHRSRLRAAAPDPGEHHQRRSRRTPYLRAHLRQRRQCPRRDHRAAGGEVGQVF